MGNRCCCKAHGATDPSDNGNSHVVAALPQPGLVAALAAAGLAALPPRSTVDPAWLNGMVQRMWPQFSADLVKLLQADAEAKMKQYLPTWVAEKMKITRFTLGQSAPKLDQVLVTHNADGVALDLNVDYNSELELLINAGDLQLGLSSVQASAHLKVSLGPLVGDVPVIAAVGFTFLDPPFFEYKFTAVAAALDHLPLVKNVMRAALDGIIAREVVSPNAVILPLVEGAQEVLLGLRAAPLGVLRATAVRGGGLTGADWSLAKKMTSDPYLRVKLADQQWSSPVVKRTTDPEWTKDNTYDFVAYDSAQRVFVEVYDADVWTGDDFIGCLAPLKLEEALASSGRQVPVFESAKAVGGAANRGHLELQWTWLALATAAMDVHGNLMSKDILVVVEVGNVVLPASVAGPLQIRLKVGGREELSKFLRPGDGAQVAAAVAASSQAVRDVVRRGAEAGLGLEKIAKITALDKETVALLLKEEGGSALPGTDLATSLSVSLPFKARLCIPVSSAATKAAPLELEVVQLGGGAAAKASLTFREIGLAWPRDGKLAVLQLRGARGLKATAELKVAIVALEPGRLP